MATSNISKAIILVVDDFDDIRLSLRLLLESDGYTVVEARDGREAVKLTLAERPDLILMDLFMPTYDGFTAAKEIQRATESREIPMVAVSAYGEMGIGEQLRQQAHRTGFIEYVEKPFNPRELLILINRLLANSSR